MKIMTEENLTWLFNNFSNYSNKQLAEKLTAKVRTENAKRNKRLKSLLDGCENIRHRQILEKEIAFNEAHSVVSVPLVKKWARIMKCPRKSKVLISEQNRRKARKTNLKKWQSKAIVIEKVIPWLRTIEMEKVFIVQARDDTQMNSFPYALWKFNKTEGKTKGIFFSASYDRDHMLIRVASFFNRAV